MAGLQTLRLLGVDRVSPSPYVTLGTGFRTSSLGTGELGFRRLAVVKQQRVDSLQKRRSGVVRNALAVETSREKHPSGWEKFRTAVGNTNQTFAEGREAELLGGSRL